MRSRAGMGFLVLWFVVLRSWGLGAHAAIVAAPGYAVHAISTPDMVQGGVIRRGTAVLVGQGAYGVGTETIVRLDGAATTVATGFNSLGGFDLDASGTLYVVDNGGAQSGAATGNTLFAIPDALTRADAVTASGHEVVPKGTIPFAQDVVVVPGGAVLVTDAVGPGVGRVVHVQGGVAANLITGLDYAAGLALRSDGTLIVGNVDPTFTGMLFLYGLDGTRTGTLVSGLSGAFDQVVDSDGNVLVSGGKTADMSSSTVIAIAPDGTITERAHGFMFSTEMYFDAARDELLVLDVGATAITAICRDRDGNGVCDADQGTTTTTVSTTTTTPTSSSTTTTTLPCTSARCTLDAARTGAACAGQTIPAGLAEKLTKAETLIDEAATSPDKRARKLRQTVKRTLKQAGKAATRAAHGKKAKLSEGCAAALKAATERVTAGL